jgi:hypothetical protein
LGTDPICDTVAKTKIPGTTWGSIERTISLRSEIT